MDFNRYYVMKNGKSRQPTFTYNFSGSHSHWPSGCNSSGKARGVSGAVLPWGVGPHAGHVDGSSAANVQSALASPGTRTGVLVVAEGGTA